MMKKSNKTFEEQIAQEVNKSLRSPTVEEIIFNKIKEAVEGDKLDVIIEKTISDILKSEEFVSSIKTKVSVEIESQIGEIIKEFVDNIRLET